MQGPDRGFPSITLMRYGIVIVRCAILSRRQEVTGNRQGSHTSESSASGPVDTNRGGSGVPLTVREFGCVLTIPTSAAGGLTRAVTTAGGDLEAHLRQALAAIRSVGIVVRSGFQAE